MTDNGASGDLDDGASRNQENYAQRNVSLIPYKYGQ